jgi:prevent-host-death family protein
MATHVPQRDLRNNPGEVLARVERGEELTITVRGRPVADLVPTRSRMPGPRLTHEQFVAGLRGLLAADDPLAHELRATDHAAEDPFGRWE